MHDTEFFGPTEAALSWQVGAFGGWNAESSVSAITRPATKTVHLTRNETLFNEGDSAELVYTVTRGCLRLCKHLADGRRQILRFARPGDYIGLGGGDEYAETVEAVSDSEMAVTKRRHLENSPEAMARATAQLLQALTIAHKHLLVLGRQTAEERVATFLLSHSKRMGVKAGTAVLLPMGRQDIADFLGLTLETVCRVLSKMKHQRLIAIPDLHHAVLYNVSALRSLACGEEGNSKRKVS